MSNRTIILSIIVLLASFASFDSVFAGNAGPRQAKVSAPRQLALRTSPDQHFSMPLWLIVKNERPAVDFRLSNGNADLYTKQATQVRAGSDAYVNYSIIKDSRLRQKHLLHNYPSHNFW